MIRRILWTALLSGSSFASTVTYELPANQDFDTKLVYQIDFFQETAQELRYRMPAGLVGIPMVKRFKYTGSENGVRSYVSMHEGSTAFATCKGSRGRSCEVHLDPQHLMVHEPEQQEFIKDHFLISDSQQNSKMRALSFMSGNEPIGILRKALQEITGCYLSSFRPDDAEARKAYIDFAKGEFHFLRGDQRNRRGKIHSFIWSGDYLRGQWSIGNHSRGRFEFLFKENQQEFIGRWLKPSSGEKGSWRGKKISCTTESM